MSDLINLRNPSFSQIQRKKGIFRIVSLTFLAVISLPTTGCTDTEKTEVLTTLQTALSNLQQNRSLTEQFVRDIKANVDPSDPGYVQAMDSYQEAREAYNRYLDSIEDGGKPSQSRSLRHSSPVDVQNATADFLADATSVLKPNVNTRRIPFQRAVVIPDNLAPTFKGLPKKARETIVDNFDQQVRWRSWGQM